MGFIKSAKSNLNSRNIYSEKVLSLLRSPFSRSNVLKKYPLISSFHRGIDGALFGVIVSGICMTSLALHSQHLWTVNFSRLQVTRDLIHRLEESTAILETYFIKSASSPDSMVATKADDLLYINRPQRRQTFFKDSWATITNLFAPISHPVVQGY